MTVIVAYVVLICAAAVAEIGSLALKTCGEMQEQLGTPPEARALGT
jgi:hypothetical protein